MEKILKGGLFFVILWSFCAAWGQNGKLTGRVTDVAGVAKPFVVVKTLDGKTGAKTDMNGVYTMSLAPGKHDIVCNTLGFLADTITITISAGKETNHDFVLLENTIVMTGVDVVVQGKTSGEIAILEEVKESDQIVNAVGGDAIKKTQDSDATAVVKRVPGVTIMGDSYIMIRGLNARYNNVMLNDVFAPSVETDVKSFAFDIVPSAMIDRILIYKSPSPEITGEFAGGVVKIYTKAIPDSNFTTFGMTTTYRQGSSFQTFLQPQRSKMHWTGFNDGYNDLPQGMPYNINTFQPSGEYTLSTVGQSLNNNWLPDQTNSLMDKSFSFTHGHKMKFDSVEVGNITSITYTNNRSIYTSERNDYNIYDDVNNQSSYIYSFDDKQYTQMIRTGIIHNWAVRFSENHKIEFKNLFTAISNSQYINRTGIDYEFNYVPNNHSFNQVYRGLYSGQLMGEHIYHDGRTRFNWATGFGYSYRDQPDYRRYRTDVDTTTGDEQIYIGVGVSPNYLGRFYSELRENSQTVSFAFEHEAEEGVKLAPMFKAGFFLERKDRQFRARNIGYVKADFMNFDPNLANTSIDSLFMPENINSTTGIKIAESTNASDSYTASNYLAAGYFGTEFQLAPKIKFNGGVRAEYNIQDLNSMTIGGDPVNVHNPILSILPSVNLSYTFIDTNDVTMLVRLAYGKTVNRPEFRELAPFGFYDFNFNLVNKGSDSLKTPVIHNFDLRWELYPGIGEMITAGVFYKQFINPIETLFIPGGGSGGIKTFTYGNAKMATSMGVEIEVRKSLRGLFANDSSFLNNFSLVGNASFIKSYVNLGQEELGQSNERPMQGQSPYIVNAGIYYRSVEKNFQFNLLYNVVGQRIFIIGFDVYPDIYEMPRHQLDFNFSKKFDNNFEVRFALGNILNQKYVLLQDANKDQQFDPSNDQIIQRYRPGSTATVGFAYTF
jgi:hypothetical protein